MKTNEVLLLYVRGQVGDLEELEVISSLLNGDVITIGFKCKYYEDRVIVRLLDYITFLHTIK